jgi:hypothetical protein
MTQKALEPREYLASACDSSNRVETMLGMSSSLFLEPARRCAALIESGGGVRP